jgi:hypothetical protein
MYFEKEVLIEQLIASLCSFSPQEKEEIALIDRFIETYAGVYSLPEPLFSELIERILSNRINNAAWQYEKASK